MSSANAAPPSLAPDAIAAKLLANHSTGSSLRPFSARPGDMLTYDVSALTSAGKTLARAALDEWSTVTGLRFKEVAGGFRPSAVRAEEGDTAASIATAAGLALGEAFDGRLGAGDRDWVRLTLPADAVTTIVLEGRGSGGLASPGLAFFDANGQPIVLGVEHSASRAEVTVGATGGGGTFYAQVVGHGGATGAYRLSLREPGGRGGAQLTFDDDRPGANAESSLSGSRTLSADINVSTSWLAKYGTTLSGYSFQTYLHEIGHALGLGHPGHYSSDAAFDEAEFGNDSWQTSVMSYFSQTENPYVVADKAYAVTPMISDIEAVRALYGAAAVRAGDTIYGEHSNAGGSLGRVAEADRPLAFTILDTGGSDLLNLASQRADQAVDLRAGGVSDVFGHKGNMVIALGTVIENARMGSGDDRVIGNFAANDLRGGGGNDRLDGGEGADRLEGGGGRDDLRGGGGHDRLNGQGGHDTLKGGAGQDRLRGNSGDDVLAGGSGDDVLKGGPDDDVLRGASGVERLDGGSGSDRLDGGKGGDRLAGGLGRDVLLGAEGDDRLDGGKGADLFVFSGTFDRDVILDFGLNVSGERVDLSEVGAIRSWADLRDEHLTEKDGCALIDAGKAGSILLLKVAASALVEDDFLF